MADEKQKMLDAYNQIQKEMLQASRDASGTDPNTAKQLRDVMGRSQQDEIGTKMQWTQDALRQGLGQYAVMREAPVTRSLNDLKDQLRKLQEQAKKRRRRWRCDKGEMAAAQALNRAENIRRQMEQLARPPSNRHRANSGNQQGKEASNRARANRRAVSRGKSGSGTRSAPARDKDKASRKGATAPNGARQSQRRRRWHQ